ncbi:Panacea domain-containing protein [Xanthovirga aplysinae]|uniref:Panacea domain-containing protein n=1 Tax=Xanthovirga aplysinae TaxID=2529853 RepID=UPI0016572F54|nr:type II toxin-antitoxin system antitoxin SocA domain-containing protein [Xanthovirga aplysinae]
MPNPHQKPLAVANYFYYKAKEDCIYDYTAMKAIKLVYLAHGWYLAISRGEPLINESVEAWKYGPVIPSVYNKFKINGTRKIISPALLEEDHERIDLLLMNEEDKDKKAIKWGFKNIEKEVLDQVWSVYKDVSGWDISMLTHKAGSPWDIVWNKQGGKKNKYAVIPNETIEEHFYKLGKSKS